jgi:hypothetical protein
MTERKFTDEEVIKALECCTTSADCEECPYYAHPVCNVARSKDALDLINRQQLVMNQGADFLEKICQIANRCCLIPCDGKPVPRKGTSRHDVYRAFYELQQMLAPISDEAINMLLESARSVFMEAISNDPPSVQSRLSSEIE